MTKTRVYIRENSLPARLAALRLKQERMAMVIGRTIHLYGVSAADFAANRAWLRHELKHVAQYQALGLLRFLAAYLWESLRKGYHHNRFEAEARQAEGEEGLCERFEILLHKKA